MREFLRTIHAEDFYLIYVICDGAAEVRLALEAEWVQSELEWSQIIISSQIDVKLQQYWEYECSFTECYERA